MNYINIFEENYSEKTKERFKVMANPNVYSHWVNTFDIELKDGKTVVVNYYGTEPIKEFKKACLNELGFCIQSVFGDKKIKVVKTAAPAFSFTVAEEPTEKTVSADIPHKGTKGKKLKAIKLFAVGMIFICLATSIIVVMSNYIGNRNFRETFYNTSSIKVDSTVRVIMLSDLHGCSYGTDNSTLLKRVAELKPDIIICTGDMVDSVTEDLEFAKKLASGLAKIAPAYYVYGNNECETIYGFPFIEKDLDEKFGFNNGNRDESAMLTLEDSFEKAIEETGMKVLKNEKDTIKVKTMTVDVYGVLNSNPSSFWSYSEKSFLGYTGENPENLKITAIHEPFIFEEFNHDYWGDLMVCGHTHGGSMRVPVLGPLYTPEGGLLPERSGKFIYGRYNVSGSPLIVSAGLENSSVLRINNEPELVVIDINKF